MKKIKASLYPFLTGLFILLFMALCFLQITIDFQIILLLGIGIFMATGYLNSAINSPIIFRAILINLPFSLAFHFMILAQIPHIWYFLVLFLLATLLGIYLKKPFKPYIIIMALLFVLSSFLVSWKYVPLHIAQSLGTELNENIGEFSLTNMQGNETLSTDLIGQVVVVDFFATWCKPCIMELEELDKIKKHFNEKEVKFYVVNSEIGGDTHAKMQAYISRTDYPFEYIFDEGSKLYEFLGFKGMGVPVLLILDKKGTLRFKHWGFNKGEAQFEAQLVSLIEELLKE